MKTVLQWKHKTSGSGNSIDVIDFQFDKERLDSENPDKPAI